MNRILIAIDFNPTAEIVATIGNDLAKALKAKIILVHVITDAAYYAIDYSPIMGYKGAYTRGAVAVVKEIKKEAQGFLDAAVEHLGDKKIETAVLEGETADAIIEHAQKWEADLIVMGSHTHRGLEKLFVPDVAAHVLKHSKIPLLTVPVSE
jgi:nucleotide-binding universal stress UspA family protein